MKNITCERINSNNSKKTSRATTYRSIVLPAAAAAALKKLKMSMRLRNRNKNEQ